MVEPHRTFGASAAFLIAARLALGAFLGLVATPAPARPDPFALRPEFVTQVAFSCGDVAIEFASSWQA